MEIRYSFLSNVDFEQMHRAFQEAFSDYHLDMRYMTLERTRLRCIKNNVHYDLSVGAFDRERLVGFTLIGIDEWEGEKAAFDAATGIVSGFRGRGVAKRMFEFALPALKEQGVGRFLLEVLTPNEAAFKAYTKTGFQVTRRLDCFKLQRANAKTAAQPGRWETRPVGKEVVLGFEQHADWMPSWENSFSSIARIPDDLKMYGAFDQDDCAGIIAYYPTLNWLMSLVVKKEYRRRGIGTRLLGKLLSELPRDIEEIKLANVAHEDKGMRAFLDRTGFDFHVGQYEMAYRI